MSLELALSHGPAVIAEVLREFDSEFIDMPDLEVMSHIKERFTEEEVSRFLMHIWRMSYGALIRQCTLDIQTKASDGSADGEPTLLYEGSTASNMLKKLHLEHNDYFGNDGLRSCDEPQPSDETMTMEGLEEFDFFINLEP